MLGEASGNLAGSLVSLSADDWMLTVGADENDGSKGIDSGISFSIRLTGMVAGWR